MSYVEESDIIRRKKIALVLGDGSGPEMMKAACAVAIAAALKDGLELLFEETPMGYCALSEFGDTLPEQSFRRAVQLGTVFFGGVGDPAIDATLTPVTQYLKPETRCLLALRKEMGLLLNFRPMIYYPQLKHLANVKPEMIPDSGIQQIWIRFLLQDSYYGNVDLRDCIPELSRDLIGMKAKSDVTGDEAMVSDIAYYRRETIEKYIRAAFAYARNAGLPLISIDKANVMARYNFWRKIVTRIGKTEFPDVKLTHQLVDSANALLFTPAALHGVIACGNEHGDILSDGAAGALGSMGMMCSSAINPDTGAAMFESGAGTAPTLAKQEKANPLGRILTGALMLRHLGAPKGAKAIEDAVRQALENGYRTADMVTVSNPGCKTLGTSEMGRLILSLL